MKVSGFFKALGGLAIIGGGLLLGDKGKDIFISGSHEAKKRPEDEDDNLDYEITIDDETTDDSQEEE